MEKISVLTVMSYEIARNLPIERRLNWIVEGYIEYGLFKFFLSTSMRLIRLSASLNQQSNITKTVQVEVETNHHFLTFETMRAIFMYYLYALATCTVIFFIELKWNQMTKAIAGRLKSKFIQKKNKKNNGILAKRRK